MDHIQAGSGERVPGREPGLGSYRAYRDSPPAVRHGRSAQPELLLSHGQFRLPFFLAVFPLAWPDTTFAAVNR